MLTHGEINSKEDENRHKQTNLNKVATFFCGKRIVLSSILFLTFVIRVIYISQTADTLFYDEWAREILTGNGAREGVNIMGPLYPFFLVLIYRIFGQSLYMVRFIQILISTFACFLTFIISQKLFNRT